jgi:hypothetical protein
MTQKFAFDLERTLSENGAAAVKSSAHAGLGRAKLPRKLSALTLGAGLSVLSLASLSLAGAAQAQLSIGGDTVAWSASTPAQAVKPGGRVKITLQGAVQSGWHVYGLQQLPDGPTPLRVSLDVSDIAAADGSPAGSPVTKLQDPSFNLQTQFYEHDFTVTAPVRIGAHAAAGQQQIPISVRFQTCNGRICQPPKTVRLSVPVNIRANG